MVVAVSVDMSMVTPEPLIQVRSGAPKHSSFL